MTVRRADRGRTACRRSIPSAAEPDTEGAVPQVRDGGLFPWRRGAGHDVAIPAGKRPGHHLCKVKPAMLRSQPGGSGGVEHICRPALVWAGSGRG